MAHAQDAREHGSRPSYGGLEVIVRIEMHCQMQDESLSLRGMQACSRRGFLSTGVLAVAGGSMMPHQTTQAQSNSLIAAKKPVLFRPGISASLPTRPPCGDTTRGAPFWMPLKKGFD